MSTFSSQNTISSNSISNNEVDEDILKILKYAGIENKYNFLVNEKELKKAEYIINLTDKDIENMKISIGFEMALKSLRTIDINCIDANGNIKKKGGARRGYLQKTKKMYSSDEIREARNKSNPKYSCGIYHKEIAIANWFETKVSL
jgi:protein-tyrosine-phosphatase